MAWAVNQWSGRDPALRDELLEAGAALRRAQEQVVAGGADGADLRSVGEREREAVGRALGAARALAEEAGSPLSPPLLERARQTLHSVALDEDVRRDFEGHRLTTEHEVSGLGGPASGAAAPPRRRAAKSAPAKAGERQATKKRREELEAADAEARKLERRRERAERDAEAARLAVERAHQGHERAAEVLREAAAQADAARARADRLREGSD